MSYGSGRGGGWCRGDTHHTRTPAAPPTCGHRRPLAAAHAAHSAGFQAARVRIHRRRSLSLGARIGGPAVGARPRQHERHATKNRRTGGGTSRRLTHAAWQRVPPRRLVRSLLARAPRSVALPAARQRGRRGRREGEGGRPAAADDAAVACRDGRPRGRTAPSAWGAERSRRGEPAAKHVSHRRTVRAAAGRLASLVAPSRTLATSHGGRAPSQATAPPSL